jgi:hypothetical protein
MHAFYVNLEFAMIVFLKYQKHDNAALKIDVFHRFMAPPFIIFGLWGLFTKDPQRQEFLLSFGLAFTILLLAAFLRNIWPMMKNAGRAKVKGARRGLGI